MTVYTPDYPILTERLRLRPFTRGDVDAVFAYRQREDVAQFLFDSPMTHETVTEAVQQRISQAALEEEGDKLVLAVDLRSTGQLIGEVSLIWRSEISRQAEIGYIFNPDFHGRGYATEAGAALLRIGFAEIALHRITARCDIRNGRSWRVMERLGMRREAHFREHGFVKGRWDDEFIYAILRREWAGRQDDGAQHG
ncbi:MAG TPA: GNAT family protein [Devosiaceae bacterium]